jgi:hypothetical protein
VVGFAPTVTVETPVEDAGVAAITPTNKVKSATPRVTRGR